MLTANNGGELEQRQEIAKDRPVIYVFNNKKHNPKYWKPSQNTYDTIMIILVSRRRQLVALK